MERMIILNNFKNTSYKDYFKSILKLWRILFYKNPTILELQNEKNFLKSRKMK